MAFKTDAIETGVVALLTTPKQRLKAEKLARGTHQKHLTSSGQTRTEKKIHRHRRSRGRILGSIHRQLQRRPTTKTILTRRSSKRLRKSASIGEEEVIPANDEEQKMPKAFNTLSLCKYKNIGLDRIRERVATDIACVASKIVSNRNPSCRTKTNKKRGCTENIGVTAGEASTTSF
jgi:hypothetical protein